MTSMDEVRWLSVLRRYLVIMVPGSLEGLDGHLFAARASNESLTKLEHELKRYEKSAKSRDVDEVLDALNAFYDIIFRGCGNDIARNVILSLRARIQFLRTTTLLRQSDADTDVSIQTFYRILETVNTRNPRATDEACVAQVHHAASVALKVLHETRER